MNRGPLWWSLIGVILLATIATVALGSFNWRDIHVGEYRPDFTLPAMNGGKHSIGDWDGEVVVLNFWAPWCAPCRREIPMLIEMQEKYGERGLQVVGIGIDSLEAIRTYANKVGINYPVLYGFEAAIKVAASYGNQRGTLPYTVVIDRDGVIRHIFHTRIERSEIEPMIRELL